MGSEHDSFFMLRRNSLINPILLCRRNELFPLTSVEKGGKIAVRFNLTMKEGILWTLAVAAIYPDEVVGGCGFPIGRIDCFSYYNKEEGQWLSDLKLWKKHC